MLLLLLAGMPAVAAAATPPPAPAAAAPAAPPAAAPAVLKPVSEVKLLRVSALSHEALCERFSSALDILLPAFQDFVEPLGEEQWQVGVECLEVVVGKNYYRELWQLVYGLGICYREVVIVPPPDVSEKGVGNDGFYREQYGKNTCYY